MEVSLQEFINGGPFGSIDVGATRSDVEQAFGKPPEWDYQARTYQKANVWRYVDIEFYFQDEKIWMIILDEFAIPDGGEQIELDPWTLTGQLRKAQVETLLQNAGIEYETQPFPHNENGALLMTKANTVLAFNGKSPDEATLRAIHRRSKV